MKKSFICLLLAVLMVVAALPLSAADGDSSAADKTAVTIQIMDGQDVIGEVPAEISVNTVWIFFVPVVYAADPDEVIAAAKAAGYTVPDGIDNIIVIDNKVYVQGTKDAPATQTVTVQYWIDIDTYMEGYDQVIEDVPADADEISAEDLTLPEGYQLAEEYNLAIYDGFVYADVELIPAPSVELTTVYVSYQNSANEEVAAPFTFTKDWEWFNLAGSIYTANEVEGYKLAGWESSAVKYELGQTITWEDMVAIAGDNMTKDGKYYFTLYAVMEEVEVEEEVELTTVSVSYQNAENEEIAAPFTFTKDWEWFNLAGSIYTANEVEGYELAGWESSCVEYELGQKITWEYMVELVGDNITSDGTYYFTLYAVMEEVEEPEVPEEPEHVCTPDAKYYSNEVEHWHACGECGKVCGLEAHTESDWILGRMPKQFQDGYMYKECTECGRETARFTISTWIFSFFG